MSKAAFLDRDGVINLDTGYPHKIEHIIFIDGIFEAVKKIFNAGYKVFIITNQAGIGRGFYTEEQFLILTTWLENEFKKCGIEITKTYHCPYHEEHGIGEYKIFSEDRKPNPGMILKAVKEFNLDLTKSFLIGDRETDIEAGKRAGVEKLILFDTENKCDKSSAHFKIQNLKELEKFI